MRAVIQTGGKQYWVQPQAKLYVEKLADAVGATITIQGVHALVDGDKIVVDPKALAKATVTAKVLSHTKADKVTGFKKRRRKGYRRRFGHRQDMTVVQIQAINA